MTKAAATVHVDLPGRAYDIQIGPDLLQAAGAFIAQELGATGANL